jgi:hypothetical protein
VVAEGGGEGGGEVGSAYADSVALHQARKREVGEELYSAKSWGGGGGGGGGKGS